MADLDYDACTNQCLSIVFQDSPNTDVSCSASDYDCMCGGRNWANRLLNGFPFPLECFIRSCAQSARSSFLLAVFTECSSHDLDVATIIFLNNPLSSFLPARTTASSFTPTSTVSTIRSTSALVAVTSSFSTQLRPSSFVSSSQAGGAPESFSFGLEASAIDGIAAGVTAAGLAIIAAVLWFIIRKRRKTPQRGETLASAPGHLHEKEKKTGTTYQGYHAQETTHELPGDDMWATMSNHASHRLPELDSVRPASELSSVRPASELDSIQDHHERLPANNATLMSPTTLPDVHEDEAASFRSHRVRDVAPDIKKKGHGRYKSA